MGSSNLIDLLDLQNIELFTVIFHPALLYSVMIPSRVASDMFMKGDLTFPIATTVLVVFRVQHRSFCVKLWFSSSHRLSRSSCTVVPVYFPGFFRADHLAWLFFLRFFLDIDCLIHLVVVFIKVV